MKKAFQKLFKFFKKILTGDGRNFLQFFLVFTVLFAVLLAILLSTSGVGVYKYIDTQLQGLTNNPAALFNRGFNLRTSSDGSSNAPQIGDGNTQPNQIPNRQNSFAGTSLYIIVYNLDGQIVNAAQDDGAAYFANQHNTLNKDFLNTCSSIELPDFGGSYRTTIVESEISYYNVYGDKIVQTFYMQILENVNQVQENLSNMQTKIIVTVLAFWLLSLFAAIYLSRWSMKPLKTALEQQKAFVSNASHELRTPISILQNRLQLLFQNPNATIIDESENISASLNEVRNMKILTTNLLNMAKHDQKLEVNPVEKGMDFFVELFENYKLLAEDAGKHFKGQVKFDGHVLIDPELIKQTLTIFFDNALKYTGESGEIAITVTKIGPNLQMQVADNGPGISDTDKKKIFDRFYRVDEARTRGKNGLGLGLSLAREIVSAMKGTIIVGDNKPQGTCFTIKLRA